MIDGAVVGIVAWRLLSDEQGPMPYVFGFGAGTIGGIVLAALLFWLRIRRHAHEHGIKHEHEHADYPPMRRLASEGWAFGSKPLGAG